MFIAYYMHKRRQGVKIVCQSANDINGKPLSGSITGGDIGLRILGSQSIITKDLPNCTSILAYLWT